MADVDHGEGFDREPYTVAVLNTGHRVEYQPGGKERTERPGLLTRDKIDRIPYTYDVVDPYTGEIEETTEVPIDDWGNPTESMPAVLDRLVVDEITDVGLVLAFGTDARVIDWPDVDGKTLVGLAETDLAVDATHGSVVGLYLDDGRLEPHVIRADTTGCTDRPPEDVDVQRLPEGPIADAYTFAVDGELDETIRDLEERDVWAEDGYPHDLTPDRKVTARNVQVAPEYDDALRHSRYWTDSGGSKIELL